VNRPLTTALAVLLACVAGCSESSPTQPTVSVATFTTEHFTFELHDGLSAADVQHVVDALEANHQRIVNDLRAGDMPRVTAAIWATQDSFYGAMQQDFGETYPGATGYVSGVAELRILLNPNSAYEAVHEFVHNVSLRVNRTIANNPRWLWEAVAVYEARTFIDPSTVAWMRPGQFPTLEELNIAYNDGGQRIYDVGYVLTDYIVRSWDMGAVINMIMANGDVPAVLGVSVEEFEQGWHAWLVSEYF